MMRKTILFFISLLTTQVLFSQSHEVEEHFVELSGNATNGDFSNNTYYVAYDSCYVSWQIIRDSVPNGWEFSFCFPNCYVPGITSGSSLFLDNSEHYLNCHIYPNNVAGSGIIEMEITTNSIHRDTITWSAIAADNLFLNESPSNSGERVINIYNLEGQILSKQQPNQILLIEYDNGSIQKSIFLN